MELSRFDAIRNKTVEVLAKAKQLYGVDINPTVSFNLRGRVAGWAGCKHCAGQRIYTLRFNRELIAGAHFEDIRDETVAHEIAHLVCYARPELGRKHDFGWKRVCLALGGNGRTRHDYTVTYAGGGITYRTTTGYEITVSKIRHTKIQNGRIYNIRGGKGQLNRHCQWVPQGRAFPIDNARTSANMTTQQARRARSNEVLHST